MKSETSVQKRWMYPLVVVHWLKIKEECKLDENEGFVPNGGNLLCNSSHTGHMVIKEGLKDHVRTTQGHMTQIGAKIYWEHGLWFAKILHWDLNVCALAKQHCLWRVHMLAVLYCNNMLLVFRLWMLISKPLAYIYIEICCAKAKQSNFELS